MRNTIVLDIETTGININKDEIIQISIIDDREKILLNTFVKPTTIFSWPIAEKINHISPQMVEKAPTMDELIPKIQNILDQSTKIVTYNGDSFDLPFLKKYGLKLDECCISEDVMKIYSKKKQTFQNGKLKRFKLVDCAKELEYKWLGNAHNSLNDVKATLYCYKALKLNSQKKSYD